MADEYTLDSPTAILDSANLYNLQASTGAGRDWGTAIKDSIETVGIDAGVGILNTGISALNFFGSDIKELDVHDTIKALDNEAAGFYLEHSASIDAWATVAGAIVPGTLGIKALRLAQSGTKVGTIWETLNLEKGLAGARAELKSANEAGGAIGGYFGSQFLGAVAKGYGAQALDALAFETAATLTQLKAPAYSDATGFDHVTNILTNTLVGGVIGGSFSAIKTGYQVKSAMGFYKRKTFDNEVIQEETVDASTKVALLLNQVDDGLNPATNARNLAIKSKLPEELARLNKSGTDFFDSKLTDRLFDSAQKGDANHMQVLPGLSTITTVAQEAERLSSLTQKLEARMSLAMPNRGGAATKLNNQIQQSKLYVDLVTGEAKTDFKEVSAIHLGDGVVKGKKLEAGWAGNEVSLDGGKTKLQAISSYSTPDDVLGLQAKRYLLASKRIEPSRFLDEQDYPDMEHWVQNWKGDMTIEVGGVEVSSPTELRMLMQEMKMKDLRAANFSPKAQAALNVKSDGLDGLTKDWDIAVDSNSMKSFLENPRHAVMTYSNEFRKQVVDNDLIQRQKFLDAQVQACDAHRSNAISLIGKSHSMQDMDTLTVSDEKLIQDLNYQKTIGTPGSGILTNANADPGMVTQALQKIGAWANKNITLMQDKSGLALRPLLNSIQSDWSNLGVEGVRLRNKLALTQANYAMINPEIRNAWDKFVAKGTMPENGLIRQDIAKWLLTAEDSGKLPKFKMKDLEIAGDDWHATSKELAAFHQTNADIGLGRRNSSSALAAVRSQQDQPSSFSHDLFTPVYNTPRDTTRYPFFVLVTEKEGLGATSHKSVLTAKSDEALKIKMDKLETEMPGKFDFHYKEQTASYFKQQGEYDYSRGMNDNRVDSTLRRKGMLGDVDEKNLPVGQKAVQEFIDDHIAFNNRMDAKLVRDMVETRYSNTFQTLLDLGKQHELASNSKFVGKNDWWYGAKNNPFADAMKLAMNISNKDNYAPMLMANEWVERTGSSVFGKIQSMFQDVANAGSKDLDLKVLAMNQKAEELGIGQVYSKTMLKAMDAEIAQRPIMYSMIQRAQAILSGLTLGTDALNAINNAIGSVVLTGELHSLIQAMKAGNAEVAGKLAGVKIPGTTDSMLAPAKLIGSSISRYWKGGDVYDEVSKTWIHKTGPELIEQYRFHGIVADDLMQMRMIQEEMGSGLSKSMQDMNNAIDKGLEFGRKVTGNSAAERFSRFLAADTARQLTDHAQFQGLISSNAEASAYWMTTANRAQGSIIASQRPVAFQGPIGAAMGLFMSYQMNMMQQFARYIGTGQHGALATAMVAQTGLYGMQGLPAFNAINTHLIGNAAGNINHKDLYSSIQGDNPDSDVGDWLLYGAGSNALGLFHPDLKINLYTRGDINPRQLTVLPTSISELPIYNATVKTMKDFVDTVQNMAGGAGVRESILHGLEHNSVSRPLAGLAQLLQGAETDKSGKLLTSLDNNLLTIGVKLAGGKRLDSASANDALFRMAAYKAHDSDMKKEIAQELRINAGDANISEEQLADFQIRYAKAGGKIDGFNSWAVQQYKFATVPQANLFAMQQGNRLSLNMQQILGAGLLKGKEEEE